MTCHGTTVRWTISSPRTIHFLNTWWNTTLASQLLARVGFSFTSSFTHRSFHISSKESGFESLGRCLINCTFRFCLWRCKVSHIKAQLSVLRKADYGKIHENDPSFLLPNWPKSKGTLSTHSLSISKQAPSYASSKLRPTDLLTGVKCRATSEAKKYLTP